MDRPNHATALAHVYSLAASPETADAARVASWVLEQMTDTFLLLAFAAACDDCDAAGTPHPNRPGPGGDYGDAMPAPSAELREEAEEGAGALYLAILKAPGGYDPAPALVRWRAADNYVDDRWKFRGYPPGGQGWCSDDEAAARCWGRYAVMSAVGHGVCWEDDNEPLTAADNVRTPSGTRPRVLFDVSDLAVSAEAPTWDDEYTRAAWARLDADEAAFNARIEAERANAERAEARREQHLARAHARQQED